MAIRLRDDAWSRLPWVVPLALLTTALSQYGFLSLLLQPAAVRPVPPPIDVQVVEVPAAVTPPVARPAPPVHRTAPTRPPAPVPKPVAESPVPPVTAPPSIVAPEPPREPVLAAAPSSAAADAGVAAPRTTGEVATETTPGVERPGPTAALPSGERREGPAGGRDTMSARAIYRPLPAIPESLRNRTVDLVAVARFRVTAAGSAEVELTQPTTDPDLNRALLETLRRWRFFPAIQAGKPVASTVDIRIPISVR